MTDIALHPAASLMPLTGRSSLRATDPLGEGASADHSALPATVDALTVADRVIAIIARISGKAFAGHPQPDAMIDDLIGAEAREWLATDLETDLGLAQFSETEVRRWGTVADVIASVEDRGMADG